MSATIPFKRLVLRAVLRDVSPMAGTTVAFGYSAALFFAGEVLVARLRARGDSFPG
jgi:hypothetical protein